MAQRFDRVPDINARAQNLDVPSSNQLGYGIGDGITNQLEGTYQMVRHPLDTANALYNAARNALSDPGGTATGIKNSLAQQYRTATGSSYGLGATVGEFMNPRSLLRMFKPNVREMTAYHGTPHTFEPHPDAPLGKFDLAKIGTGEGAQAYGHGIYVAENPKVAGEYAKIVPDTFLGPVNARLTELAKLMEQNSGPGYRSFKNDVGKQAAAEYDKLMQERADYKGSLYHVDVPDEHVAKMLDWDKPLNQQPENVQSLISGLGDHLSVTDADGTARHYALTQDAGRMTGAGLYDALSRKLAGSSMDGQFGQRKASELLKSAGIPGIKYLDAGSRGAEGTRNLVLFDPNIAKIIHKE